VDLDDLPAVVDLHQRVVGPHRDLLELVKFSV
jgi:hypothetical protein